MTNTIDNAPRALKPCPFCGGEADPKGWMSSGGEQGPACDNCGATASSADEWNARAPSPAGVDGLEPSGYDDLWLWFGSSRSAWLTLPRSLMHSMPDDWQKQMAGLLDQWDAAWNTAHLPAPYVSARDGAKFTRWPEWLLNYRHTPKAEIEAVRALSAGKEGE